MNWFGSLSAQLIVPQIVGYRGQFKEIVASHLMTLSNFFDERFAIILFFN